VTATALFPAANIGNRKVVCGHSATPRLGADSTAHRVASCLPFRTGAHAKRWAWPAGLATPASTNPLRYWRRRCYQTAPYHFVWIGDTLSWRAFAPSFLRRRLPPSSHHYPTAHLLLPYPCLSSWTVNTDSGRKDSTSTNIRCSSPLALIDTAASALNSGRQTNRADGASLYALATRGSLQTGGKHHDVAAPLLPLAAFLRAHRRLLRSARTRENCRYGISSTQRLLSVTRANALALRVERRVQGARLHNRHRAPPPPDRPRASLPSWRVFCVR